MSNERIVEVCRTHEYHRIAIGQLSTSRLAQLFELDPQSIYLKELSGNGVLRFPSNDGTFNLADDVNDYEVEGRTRQQMPNQQYPANDGVVMPQGLRPPAPVVLSVPGAPAVGVPPPASRIGVGRKRRSAPAGSTGVSNQDQLMLTNVYYAEEFNRKGRPVRQEQWPLSIISEEANVPAINQKLTAMIGKEVVIHTAEGVKIMDCDATKREPKCQNNDGKSEINCLDVDTEDAQRIVCFCNTTTTNITLDNFFYKSDQQLEGPVHVGDGIEIHVPYDNTKPISAVIPTSIKTPSRYFRTVMVTDEGEPNCPSSGIQRHTKAEENCITVNTKVKEREVCFCNTTTTTTNYNRFFYAPDETAQAPPLVGIEITNDGKTSFKVI